MISSVIDMNCRMPIFARQQEAGIIRMLVDLGIMTEGNLLRSILLAVGRIASVRLFRNNTGVGVSPNGGVVRYGLCNGSSDLIGWQSVTVTPDMVGQKIARFVAVEVKTERGKPSQEQLNFIAAVRSAGGIGEICRSPEDARKIFG